MTGLSRPLEIASLPAGVYHVRIPGSPHPGNDDPSKKFIYRINTGSPLPAGTNAVVMVEDTKLVRSKQLPNSTAGVPNKGEGDLEEAEVELLVGTPTIRPWENVRQPGSDVREGELVLEKGVLISSKGGEVGTLAFVGVREVSKTLC